MSDISNSNYAYNYVFDSLSSTAGIQYIFEYGYCGYCKEYSDGNINIGILICKGCLKKVVDSILTADINKRAIKALKVTNN